MRFNYAVEIGAHKAYVGHYRRTKDAGVWRIAKEEIEHRVTIGIILNTYKKRPFFIFNAFFEVVGSIIQVLCKISPIALLDLVARCMEIFAVFSYNLMAELYPEWRGVFLKMAKHELRHQKYFENEEK